VSIPPDIEVSAGQLLFGGIVIDNLTDRTLTVQNKGMQDLNIGQVAGADPLDLPFSIVTDDCSQQTLASMRTCNVLVRFKSTAQGAFNDTFDIPSNDPDENSVTVNVSGDGKGLNVSINQVGTSCPTVTLYITVSDSDGDPLSLLTKDNFSLFENGVAIAPGVVTFDDTVTSPRSIALVLDISASMELRDAINEMQAAAVSFVRNLTAPPDEAEIIRFAKSIEPVPVPVFTTDTAALEAAINADPDINPVDFRDGTAMYDAVSQASS